MWTWVHSIQPLDFMAKSLSSSRKVKCKPQMPVVSAIVNVLGTFHGGPATNKRVIILLKEAILQLFKRVIGLVHSVGYIMKGIWMYKVLSFCYCLFDDNDLSEGLTLTPGIYVQLSRNLIPESVIKLINKSKSKFGARSKIVILLLS